MDLPALGLPEHDFLIRGNRPGDAAIPEIVDEELFEEADRFVVPTRKARRFGRALQIVSILTPSRHSDWILTGRSPALLAMSSSCAHCPDFRTNGQRNLLNIKVKLWHRSRFLSCGRFGVREKPMKPKFFHPALIATLALAFGAAPAGAQRNGYSHLTALEGAASVASEANGEVDAVVNLPLAEGDQIVTGAGGRVEVELADGNRFQVAGESRIKLDSLADQQGSSSTESSINVIEGSVAAESLTGGDAALRVDTPDVSVYLPSQSQARINIDPGRGTSVVVRRGEADVQTRSGSTTVRQGSYLMIHGGDPEVARGSFSRDRFDIWVADRTDSTLAAYNSASARYVEGSDYDEDVAVLDNYGQWDYSPTYQAEVWRPSVSADWCPYSDGYWYSTPIGASWVSNEPWGWFPHHYGNWFFDAAFNSWCWSPAYLFSPAWVYWGFSPSFVGWCPIGYYSWGRRSGSSVAVNGIFDPSRIDIGRGWRFVGTDHFGQRFDRRSLLPGSAVAGRLGSSFAVTSRPAIAPVSGRPGSAPAQLQAYARTAPQTISRQTTAIHSAELTPYLARQRSLPAATVRALSQENAARVDSGRGTGPGTARLPAAGTGRALAGGRFGTSGTSENSTRESWRSPSAESRPSDSRAFSNSRSFEPRTRTGSPVPQTTDRRSDWRQRPSSNAYESGPRASETGPSQNWRSRYSAPPAQRVIEGIDRGRQFDSMPRNESPRRFESAPRRFENPTPQRYEAPRREQAQPPRSSPPPRMESRREAPPPARSEARSSSREDRRPHR